jgi:hypothetical protein
VLKEAEAGESISAVPRGRAGDAAQEAEAISRRSARAVSDSDAYEWGVDDGLHP